MRNKFTSILTAILLMMGTISAISVNAAETIRNEDGTCTITTDKFTYTSSPFRLKSELCDADFMVVGIRHTESILGYDEYYISPIRKPGYFFGYGAGILVPDVVTEDLGGMKLQVGDLLKFEGGISATESYVPYFAPHSISDSEPAKAVYLGNGIDLFGEDFSEVIRRQCIFEQALNMQQAIRYQSTIVDVDWGGYTVNWGDVNLDDELDILDCISVNKYLLGSSHFCFYTKEIADVNMDGKLDSTDSLAILKEVVGLTKDYQPVGEQTAE